MLTHFTDKATEAQRHLIIRPGGHRRGLGFLLRWVSKSGTWVFRRVVLVHFSNSNRVSGYTQHELGRQQDLG